MPNVPEIRRAFRLLDTSSVKSPDEENDSAYVILTVRWAINNTQMTSDRQHEVWTSGRKKFQQYTHSPVSRTLLLSNSDQ